MIFLYLIFISWYSTKTSTLASCYTEIFEECFRVYQKGIFPGMLFWTILVLYFCSVPMRPIRDFEFTWFMGERNAGCSFPASKGPPGDTRTQNMALTTGDNPALLSHPVLQIYLVGCEVTKPVCILKCQIACCEV